jgi:hypothetical protein
MHLVCRPFTQAKDVKNQPVAYLFRYGTRPCRFPAVENNHRVVVFNKSGHPLNEE